MKCTDDDDDDDDDDDVTRDMKDGLRVVVCAPENAAMSFETSLCMNGTSVSSDCDDSRITPRRESRTRLAAEDMRVVVINGDDAIRPQLLDDRGKREGRRKDDEEEDV